MNLQNLPNHARLPYRKLRTRKSNRLDSKIEKAWEKNTWTHKTHNEKEEKEEARKQKLAEAE